MKTKQDKIISIASEKDPVKNVWENIVVKGSSQKQNVRPEILRSWTMCKEFDLDPYSRKSPTRLPPKQLEKLLASNQQLIIFPIVLENY